MEQFSQYNKKQLLEFIHYIKDYKIRYKTNCNLPKNLSFGTEIEFSNIPITEVNRIFNGVIPSWRIYTDNSLQEYVNGNFVGVEIATDILHDQIEDWTLLQLVLETLRSQNATITQKCSNHVHIGAQIFKEDINQVIRFIKLWCIYEDIIYRFGYGSSFSPRKSIPVYAPPIMPVYRSLLKQKKLYLESIQSLKQIDFGKNNGINFHNYSKLSEQQITGNDIEIRICNGTLEETFIQNQIVFFLHLMLYVTSDNFDEARINQKFNQTMNEKWQTIPSSMMLNIRKVFELVDLIYTREIDKMNFLKQYLKAEDNFTLERELSL